MRHPFLFSPLPDLHPREYAALTFRTLALATMSLVIGTALAILLMEGVFWFLPVSDGLMANRVDDQNPVFRFSPNRDVTWSRDWNFSIVNKLHINNAGFVNNQQYVNDERPLLAVVGDSYVEAAMVPYVETLHGRLSAELGNTRKIYSFAASGAALSQYVVWAKEAKEKWGANALAIVIIANDFDESLMEYKSAPGFHYYQRDTNGALKLVRQDYYPSRIRTMSRNSALLRYLALNLHALEKMRMLINSVITEAQAQTYVGNTSADASPKRLQDSREAVSAFLRDLVSEAGWQPNEIMFLVDGVRYPGSVAQASGSYFSQMRSHFMAESRRNGFQVVDLDPHFFETYKTDNQRYEFPTDGHWNGHAHQVAAQALLSSPFLVEWQLRDTPE